MAATADNFALPNLQSRLPIHMGQGTGLSAYVIGQASGSQRLRSTTQDAVAHPHAECHDGQRQRRRRDRQHLYPPSRPWRARLFYASPPASHRRSFPQTLAATAYGTAGGSQPHNNLMPSLCITFIIALLGIFPSQN